MGVPKPRRYLLPHTTQLLPRLGEKSFGLDGSGSAGGCLCERREGGLAGALRLTSGGGSRFENIL